MEASLREEFVGEFSEVLKRQSLKSFIVKKFGDSKYSNYWRIHRGIKTPSPDEIIYLLRAASKDDKIPYYVSKFHPEFKLDAYIKENGVFADNEVAEAFCNEDYFKILAQCDGEGVSIDKIYDDYGKISQGSIDELIDKGFIVNENGVLRFPTDQVLKLPKNALMKLIEHLLKFVDYDDLTSGERNCLTDTYDTTLEARKKISSFFDLARKYAEECALKGRISDEVREEIKKHLEIDLDVRHKRTEKVHASLIFDDYMLKKF